MCGFAGYKAFYDTQLNLSLAQELADVLEHRGPDGAGIWTSEENQLLLVARRLSIIDISSGGDQPMCDSENSVAIVYNGEIYNYRNLRAILEKKGYQFRSQSDTEVVLYAFKEWGINCLHHLDGMFAGAIFERKSGRIFLFRDRIGIKPLYFSFQGNTISFASEIKALWKMPWISRHISLRSLSHYLTYLATPAPMTLFTGIYKLPAGFYSTINPDGTFTFTQWYDPIKSLDFSNKNFYQDEDFCIAKVRTLLEAAVEKRLIADVPVGALLSGGLDSSLIVALMAHHTSSIDTFTVSFEHDQNEERAWARKIAKKFGTNHHELILAEDEALSFIKKMIYHQDEPLGDSVCIPLYFVSKLARDAGMKVLLLGEGSDELFCGYPLYADYLSLYRYWQISQRYIPAVARKGVFYAARPFYKQYPNRQDLVNAWVDGRSLFWGGVRVFSELWKKDILHAIPAEPTDPIIEAMYPGFPQDANSYAIADYYRAQFYHHNPAGDFFASMTYIELKHRLPELLLTRTDKMTMAASIEARVPYLDYTLVEAALQIPMKYKYHQQETKYILKQVAAPLLPADIIYRKKIGFGSPVTYWFKHGHYFRDHLMDLLHQKQEWQDIFNKEYIKQLMEINTTASIDYSYQLWALYNILAF